MAAINPTPLMSSFSVALFNTSIEGFMPFKSITSPNIANTYANSSIQ